MLDVAIRRGAAGDYNEGIWAAMLAAAPVVSAQQADAAQYELDDLDRALLAACRKGVEYLDNGDPLKDVLDGDDIEAAVRLLVDLVDSPAAPAQLSNKEPTHG